MWQTMVRPLFNAALALLKYEPSLAQRENLPRLWFKDFMMVSNKANTKLVDDMININLDDIAENVVGECKKQWEQRKNKEDVKSKK